MEPRYYDLPFGITTIDTGLVRPGFTASHLIVEDGQAAFVDVGPATTLPVLLEVLRQKQIPQENVQYLMVTHVHLDHAGGAGKLIRELPNAQVVVHPKGARHLVSPERLIAGATAVYGEEIMHTLIGEIVPVPEERIIQAEHEFCLDLNGRQLLFLDTPGHARHHYCIVDERSQGIFSGDTFGLSYREFDTAQGHFIFPATAPVQFEPDKLHASIDLLMKYQPTSMYLTHFGRVTGVSRLADDLHEWIDQLVEFGREVKTSGQARYHDLSQNIEHLMLIRLRSHGCELNRDQMRTVLEPDLKLNVLGLEVWLDRIQKHKEVPKVESA
jgi:glyoxylase-like metal-dependent hydrolase (beta-lactamase superfamily II)